MIATAKARMTKKHVGFISSTDFIDLLTDDCRAIARKDDGVRTLGLMASCPLTDFIDLPMIAALSLARTIG